MNIFRLDSNRLLAVTGFITVCSFLFYFLKAGTATWWLALCPIPTLLGAMVHRLFFTENLVLTADTIARQGYFYDERILLKNGPVECQLFKSAGGLPTILNIMSARQSVVVKLEGPEENWDVWPYLRRRLIQNGHGDINQILAQVKPGDFKSFRLSKSDWLSLTLEVAVYTVSLAIVAIPILLLS